MLSKRRHKVTQLEVKEGTGLELGFEVLPEQYDDRIVCKNMELGSIKQFMETLVMALQAKGGEGIPSLKIQPATGSTDALGKEVRGMEEDQRSARSRLEVAEERLGKAPSPRVKAKGDPRIYKGKELGSQEARNVIDQQEAELLQIRSQLATNEENQTKQLRAAKALLVAAEARITQLETIHKQLPAEVRRVQEEIAEVAKGEIDKLTLPLGPTSPGGQGLDETPASTTSFYMKESTPADSRLQDVADVSVGEASPAASSPAGSPKNKKRRPTAADTSLDVQLHLWLEDPAQLANFADEEEWSPSIEKEKRLMAKQTMYC